MSTQDKPKKKKTAAQLREAVAKRHAAVIERAKNFDHLPDSAYVRTPVVCAIYGISPMTAYRWGKEGRLPAAEKLGPGVTAFNVGKLREARKAKAA